MVKQIKELLSEDEVIIKNSRIHWIVFLKPALLVFIGFLASIFFHPLLGLIIFIVALQPSYVAFVHYKMTHLVLTDKKVLSRMGFLSTDWTQMAFDKVENAFLEEPIIGRYLGYSTVIVSGVGSGSVAVSYVIDGDKFIKALEEKLN